MTVKWWPKDLLYVTDVTNRLPMARLGLKTPYELLHRKKPSGLALWIWGTTCYAHVPKTKRKDPKLSDRAIQFKLLGLSHNYKEYCVLDVKGNRYLIARNVKFNSEGTAAMIKRLFSIEDSSVDQREEIIIRNVGKRLRGDLEVKEISSELVTQPSTSRVWVDIGTLKKRQKTPNLRLKDYMTRLNAVATDTVRIPIPKSIKETRLAHTLSNGSVQN
ncbi:Retroelement pol Polyprotein-like [Phytophthora palmivora]|uniref:Retroelement pol Polyprotein-like n=1 Tax=Phytophthora palmivora TaxID=4796 RepID=A0A2P4XGF5_9STRA|nr:Retroelement pol Polyprotein-like [Phytophthora palmivora]